MKTLNVHRTMPTRFPKPEARVCGFADIHHITLDTPPSMLRGHSYRRVNLVELPAAELPPALARAIEISQLGLAGTEFVENAPADRFPPLDPAQRYRKKPVRIEAVRFDRIVDLDTPEFERLPAWMFQALGQPQGTVGSAWVEDGYLCLQTHQGEVRANPGDYVIRQVDGELYPCRADIFTATYEPAVETGMSFGEALSAMKAGERVARAGWNGKGMWVALTPGSTFPALSARSGAAQALAMHEPVETIAVLPHIDMRAADGSLVIGWLASQTDMLAEDWAIVRTTLVKAPEPAKPLPPEIRPDFALKAPSAKDVAERLSRVLQPHLHGKVDLR